MVKSRFLEKIKEFRETFFNENRELFEKLAEGQSPDTMMITCSDSRVVPHIKMGAFPGEIFMFRNMGNFIPPHIEGREDQTGVAAFLEYGTSVLGAKHIVVMGHTNCGAVKGLITGEADGAVGNWLRNGEALRRIILDKWGDEEEDPLMRGCEENVRFQVENIKTYPFLRELMEKGELTIHGWLYDVKNGEVYALREEGDDFVLLT